jgi:acyl-CoA synthetase (AMP-forming)/AMP-acid ligase II
VVRVINLADVWEGVAEALPDADALAHGDLVRSYSVFENRAARLATVLTDHGVGRDDKVALYLYNGPEYLEAQFAAFKVRAIPCNVNYRYVSDELAYLLQNSDASALVYDGALAPSVAAVVDRCPKLRLLVQVGAGELVAGAMSYEDAISAHEPARPIERSGDDLWFLYTGGTTGHPKAVMWRHGDLVDTMAAYYAPLDRPVPTSVPEAVDVAVELHARNRTTRLLAAAPLMHGTAGVAAIQLMVQGAMVATLTGRSFDADELWEAVARHRLTLLAIVGDVFARPMLESLRRAEAAGRPHDLSSLYQILSSGVMWSAESKQELLRYRDMTLLDALGSSEGLGMGRKTTRRGEAPTTAKFRLGPNTAVMTEEGRHIEPGSDERGLLALGGPIPIGYYKDPERTAATFREIAGQRWSVPGDYATVEADGSIVLLGRGSACINSGGEKIFPEEVEEALKTHPAVHDSNVVGLPDDRWGEAVTALVSLERGRSVSDQELVAHTRLHLAPYKAPKIILRVPEVRRGANGKPDYRWARSTAAAMVAARGSGSGA